MTSEEISALPNPPFRPARDMMLCSRMTESATGIHLPDQAVDKVQMCRVLVVGPGLLLDDGKLKECPYKRGARVFICPQDGYPITLDGTTYWIVEANEVMGEILNETTMAFGRDIV